MQTTNKKQWNPGKEATYLNFQSVEYCEWTHKTTVVASQNTLSLVGSHPRRHCKLVGCGEFCLPKFDTICVSCGDSSYMDFHNNNGSLTGVGLITMASAGLVGTSC